MAGLRLVDLQSDPYRGLDWDTGLMTDEGFYTHNARNVALFGQARTDEFNNMLASPLLHYLQVAVFSVTGFSAVNARLISVVLSLLTLAVYFAAMRRAFGIRVAVTAALFLGLDHTNVLFNRMALLDTPATLLAVCALYTLVRAERDQPIRRNAWLAGCGILLGLTLITRSLCVYLIPAAVIAAIMTRRDRVSGVGSLLGGLLAVLFVYAAVWYLPHKFEMDQMNRYYRTVQLQPDSAARLFKNIRIAFLGDRYGVFPNIFRHTPVLFSLALLTMAGFWNVSRTDRADRTDRTATTLVFLTGWILVAWTLFAFSNYAPNRYFVSTYPPLFALASVGLWRLPSLVAGYRQNGLKPAVGLGLVVWFLGYHALESVVHRGVFLYVVPTLLTAVVLVWRGQIPGLGIAARSYAFVVVVPVLILWTGVNAGWLADWWVRREYTLSQSSEWLGRNLPAGSVLLGDVAPGLGMDTPFVTVNVMKGFANDARPVEAFAPRPRYILTIDGKWKTPYWIDRYPERVHPSRRIRHWRVMRWMVGLYPASE